MKTMTLLLAGLCFALLSCGQQIPAGQVPSVVQNTVKTKFAHATDIDWEKKEDKFEAEFDINNTDHKALLDASGKLIMYKMDIAIQDLPPAVSGSINSQHAGYVIDDAEKLEKDGKVYYQVELDARGKKEKRLVYTTDGQPAADIQFML